MISKSVAALSLLGVFVAASASCSYQNLKVQYALTSSEPRQIVLEGSLTAVQKFASYSIQWAVLTDSVQCIITNTSDATIRVVWDETTFVYPTGRASGVIHSGVRFLDKQSTQSPTVIPAGTHVEEVMAPKDSVRWANGWIKSPILGMRNSPKDLEGKNFSINLAVESGGKLSTQRFTFQVTSVQIEKGRTPIGQAVDNAKKIF